MGLYLFGQSRLHRDLRVPGGTLRVPLWLGGEEA